MPFVSRGLPRRLIDELITGWQLTGERVVVVEGTDDQRFLRLVQAEEHCDEAFASLLSLSADAVEVPGEVVARHGFVGTGAKQRVIAFAREIERAAAADGFRGVVDRDQDQLLESDFSSEVLRYTDHGSMEVYGWSLKALRQLIVQFQCDTKVPTTTALRRLFKSINEVCATLAAVRAIALRNPDFNLDVHHTPSTLATENASVRLDLPAYIRLAGPPKGTHDAVAANVMQMQADIVAGDPLGVVNGHDLVWVLVVVIRDLSVLPRRVVDEAAVAGTVVSAGVMDPGLFQHSLFRDLAAWAAA